MVAKKIEAARKLDESSGLYKLLENWMKAGYDGTSEQRTLWDQHFSKV